ncbi:TetR family transcriptional regulator [Natranaerobius thermophilus]|uniref:Transcriptional regulator, TetR family n=1 Tax=Natranaerobius thermophilus (strain ATCC BAA-1301 / DSM 18059 / JW/NM-WN-LF) TaxID=457570 RepID=B2A7I6_NATTJ|nr:TetR family transcriptional regulator [Natranaerobius thermophilus]ACB85695.1 transcriptional regulator, TetR family [Natranaerobius thermophilus JW/NM-WN-LF]
MTHSQTNKYHRLIQAAIEIIKEQGFEKTSVSQIVNRAGVAQGTFYLYFKSKNELVPAIAQMILNEQFRRLKLRYPEKSPSLEELLDAIIDTTFEITREYKELILFCYSGLAYYYSFERWEEIYEPYYKWLEDKICEIRSLQKVQQENNTYYLANYIVNLVEHGAELFYLSNGFNENLDESKQELKKFLKRSLNQRGDIKYEG